MERATSLSRPRTSPQLVGAVFLGVRPSTASSRHCGGCHASPLRRSMETNHHGRVGSLHSLRGTHTRVHSETSTLTRPKRTSVGTRPVSRSHRRLTGQTGGGEGTRPFFSRFLQTSFLSTKEKRQMETSDRPKDLTLFLSKPTFKMETTALSRALSSQAIGAFHWTCQTRSFMYQYTPIQEIPSLCLQRPGFPVPGNAFRPSHYSKRFHKPHGSRRLPSQTQRCTPS